MKWDLVSHERFWFSFRIFFIVKENQQNFKAHKSKASEALVKINFS